jgi:hypothetical protein
MSVCDELANLLELVLGQHVGDDLIDAELLCDTLPHRRRVAGEKKRAGLTVCTAGSPRVSLPVLSSTTVSIRPSVSR